jgi:glycosyltransferase involved in cell wall biosynthesis
MPVIGGTFCGGPGPRYHIPRLSPVVVFSKEQKDAFIAKWGWKPENLVVSPGRVEHPAADATQPDRGGFLSRYGLTPELLSILFVSRLSEDKRGSVETIQLLAREIAAQGLPWQVLIAGGGKMESELREFGDQLERQAGRTVLAAAGEQDRLDEFYACADVVAGVGRSIFDGMMRGKPVMVVGEKGFAGLVSPESVEELAYYNFSGRNAQADSGVEHLISAIHLAALPEERLRLGSFARRYTRENLSVGAGGKVLLEYYAQLMEVPPLPRARVLREVALSTISYVKRKSPYA